MTKSIRKTVLAAVLLALILPVTYAGATVTYNFDCLTSNDPTGQAGLTGEKALYMDVADAGGGKVLFTVGVKTGFPYGDYFIDGVYFYKGKNLLKADVVTLIETGKIDFEPPANPAHLPALDPTPANYVYTADAESPGPKCGIHAGGSLGVQFVIITGMSYNDVISGLDKKDLAVGLKVQAFGDGGNISESFVNVPEPATLLITGLGAAFVGLTGKKRSS